jgi:hypothetical protein
MLLWGWVKCRLLCLYEVSLQSKMSSESFDLNLSSSVDAFQRLALRSEQIQFPASFLGVTVLVSSKFR